MKTKPRLALIDYGMGNLKSVAKALEKVGARVSTIEHFNGLNSSFNGLILPGVGAFSMAVKNLKRRKLFQPIKKWIDQQKPFLGICLGYQLLFEESEEVGVGDQNKTEKGLGIFEGGVKKFPNSKGLKIPHMGWNRIKIVRSSEFGVRTLKSKKLSTYNSQLKTHIFDHIPNGSYFYFVHSYFPMPRAKENIATLTNYGIEFASSICKGNLFACQFHPEKSGENGLRLLKNFVDSLPEMKVGEG